MTYVVSLLFLSLSHAMWQWISQVVTNSILDVIRTLDTHWFFLCCGALVNAPSSLKTVKSFANVCVVFFSFRPLAQISRWKPANLFAFDTPAFHPILAATFLLNFFQHIIIDGRTFDSSIALLLNASPLSRHSGIVCFWTHDSVVNNCTLRWTHSRTRPWGKSVPYQCPSCRCIQAWDQKGRGAELGRDVTMSCSYKEGDEQCPASLTFQKPSDSYKALKQSEGLWVAFGLKKSEFL